MERILLKERIAEWVNGLSAYTVIAPVKGAGTRRYERVEGAAEIVLDDPGFLQSPKPVVFPPAEPLFYFEDAGNGKMEVTETLPPTEPSVVLGIRPCDVTAWMRMDKVFNGDAPGDTPGDTPDPYYRRRRENMVLVGLGCWRPPSVNCFCTQVGGAPHDKTGLDILLTDMKDSYYLETLTPRGVQLMDGVPGDLFRVPKTGERKQLQKIHAESVEAVEFEIKDVETLPDRLRGAFNDPVWAEEAQRCIRCGICTYMCPSCHCFDMTDPVESEAPLRGARVRNWDNCQFPDFTMHSSGHNPRADRAARLRRRVLHKFFYFHENHGEFLCTGCGRCISKCPVGIDIVDVVNKAGTTTVGRVGGPNRPGETT